MTVTDHYTATGNYQNLFVAKLPLGVTNADLSEVFAAYSPSSATVMLDPVSGRSKGYAFVLFASEQAGRDAAAALDKTSVTIPHPPEEGSPADHITFDLTIFASKHSRREVAAENECLYIRNIPNSWPMEQVEAFIAEHGKPVYSAVRTDHLGSPVWVVFVEYDSVESARRTLKAVHGMSVAPRCPPILAKYAENDDVKRNRRERKLGRNGKAKDGDNATAAAAPSSKRSKKASRRMDVTHQMHRPCHAARYDDEGHRIYSEDTPAAACPRPCPSYPAACANNNNCHDQQRNNKSRNANQHHHSIATTGPIATTVSAPAPAYPAQYTLACENNDTMPLNHYGCPMEASYPARNTNCHEQQYIHINGVSSNQQYCQQEQEEVCGDNYPNANNTNNATMMIQSSSHHYSSSSVASTCGSGHDDSHDDMSPVYTNAKVVSSGMLARLGNNGNTASNMLGRPLSGNSSSDDMHASHNGPSNHYSGPMVATRRPLAYRYRHDPYSASHDPIVAFCS